MPHVLIIEDDVELVSTACRALRSAGFEVSVAFDGSAGYFTAVGGRPDAIILDLDLPGLGGGHMLALLTSCRDTADTPVLAITEQPEVKGLLSGADGVLQKPFRADELLEHIGRMTRKPRGPRRSRLSAAPAA